MPNKYGYIRVSTKEQNEDRQYTALLEAGVPEMHIYIDRQSGKDFDRPAYKQLMSRLKQGDWLYIKSIDRLGRNYEEIKLQWLRITHRKKGNIVVLDAPILASQGKRTLTETFIADMSLQLFSYFAQLERDFIHQRQAEGIACAKARGVKFGRPALPLPENFHEVHKAWQKREITLKEAAALCKMPVGTFYSKAKKLEES